MLTDEITAAECMSNDEDDDDDDEINGMNKTP